MNTKPLRLLIGSTLLLTPAAARGQQASTLRGRVTTDANAPLQGASVSIQGLRLGSYTAGDGSYAITIPADRVGGTVTVTARRIGFQPRSATVVLSPGVVTQDFTLVGAPTELEQVVVTALGIERQKSQLGTSVQQVGNTELNQTRAEDIGKQIEGKVSGVQITGSGQPGGSTRIVIRGENSITGQNTPLFVVDGVPISSDGVGGSANSGRDFGSAISDINPDDIDNLSVLKGPNAAALYGSRAANGVVLITTKKGRGGIARARTDVSTFYTWERPSILPTYQNQYGQGAAGAFRFFDGAGGGVNDGADQSWGPRFDPTLRIHQFTDGADTSVKSAWVGRPNNVSDFFNTGHTGSATVAVSGGTDRANARLSIGGDNVLGYIPNVNLSKMTALLNGEIRMSDQLTTNATVNYVRNTGENRPGVGYASSILEQFIWFGRQIDMAALRKNWQSAGTLNGGPANREFNWNYNYHNNPFFLQYGNPENDTRDRLIGSLSANYRLAEGVNALLRTGSDIYRYDINQQWSPANITGAPVDPSYFGAFDLRNDYRNENNTDLLVTADRDLTSGLRLNATAGGSVRQEQYTRDNVQVTGISTPGIYNVSNAAVSPTLGQYSERRRVNSVLGAVALTFNGWLTVEGTDRNDWSSTLPSGQNSYNYPSLNTSIILTEALPSLRNGVVSYLKLRGSVAGVGNDAPVYSLRTTYSGFSNKFNGQPQFTLSDVLANANLKPELTRASEGGVELGFFDGRATLDASYYDKATRNQIFNVPISPTTGFYSKTINAGRMTNRGVEALLTVVPIRTDGGVQWSSTFNYSHNRNMVAELYSGIKTLVLGSTWYTNVEARQGQPYGSLFGYSFARDGATGQLLTNGGLTVQGPRKVLGNIQPTWTGGWSNTFTYKNVTVSGLLDIRRGGQIFSVSNYFGEYSGVFKSSLRGREVDWNNPGLIIQGIDQTTGKPNTVRVTAEEYFQNIFPVNEPYIYDDSYVKLRELRIGVDLPPRWANRFAAQSMNVAFVGRNLKTWTNVPNVDPEFSYTIGNVQGEEYAVLPNPRTFGLSVRLTP